LLVALGGFRFSASAIAQVVNWPNPEVEQLYRSAQASLAAGAFRQAIASYQQAVNLAPEQSILYRDLAQAYLLSGNPLQAEKVITPLIDKGRGDAQAYVIAAGVQTSLREDRKARKLLDEGVAKYPNSGYLYHERGRIAADADDPVTAVKMYTTGMRAEPGYHLNYYDAARLYIDSSEPVWAIIYGEIFVNLERPTARSGETRKLLLAAYKRFYAQPDLTGTPRFGKKRPSGAPSDFAGAVSAVLLKLAPVVADGISTENLTMLRTRFIIDWKAVYWDTYPFTLFRMHDDLLRAGHFDAYNQWLFGRAENPAQVDAWNKFHPDAIPGYERYYQSRPLQLSASDAYNADISKKTFESSNNPSKR
jgi:tetratricopeptide (TPR) repeat protein